MVIFHCNVSSPEGIGIKKNTKTYRSPHVLQFDRSSSFAVGQFDHPPNGLQFRTILFWSSCKLDERIHQWPPHWNLAPHEKSCSWRRSVGTFWSNWWSYNVRVFRFASGRFWHYHFFGRSTIIDTYGTSFRALSYLEVMKRYEKCLPVANVSPTFPLFPLCCIFSVVTGKLGWYFGNGGTAWNWICWMSPLAIRDPPRPYQQSWPARMHHVPHIEAYLCILRRLSIWLSWLIFLGDIRGESIWLSMWVHKNIHCHRIGSWENFNRKPLYLMVKTHGFPLKRFSPTNQSIDIGERFWCPGVPVRGVPGF